MSQSQTCQWLGGCGQKRIKGQRYCPTHRAAMLQQMVDAGYLPESRRPRMPARLLGPRPVPRVESIIDRLDDYQDRANEAGVVDE